MIKINGKNVSRIPINGKETLRVMQNGQQLWSGTGLPAGYTLLEYIESTGQQYIDTGFKPDNNSSIFMDVTPLSVVNGNPSGFFFGSSTPSYKSGIEVFAYNGTIRACWYDVDTAGTTPVSANERMNVRLEKNKVNVYRDSDLVYSNTFSNKSFTSATNLCLAALPRNEMHYGLVKIHSCQIYDNDILVRDYIPCMNTQGVYGLYDKVNKQFYGSASTTGFIGG